MFQFVRLDLYAFPLPGRVQAAEQVGNALKADVVHRRFERGEICFAAVYEGKIVSYCWMAQGKIGIEEIDLAVATLPDEVYLYDAYTLDEWRGKGLYPAVLNEMLLYAGQTGFSRALIFVAVNNTASRRGVLKAGFVEFQVVTYLSILGIPFYRYSQPLHGQRAAVFKPL